MQTFYDVNWMGKMEEGYYKGMRWENEGEHGISSSVNRGIFQDDRETKSKKHLLKEHLATVAEK